MAHPLPNVTLGKLLTERKEFIEINDLARYKRVRNQWYGKGIVLRDEVNGSEIKTKRQQIVRAGEFIVAEIDAKEGSFGIVHDELDGGIVSSHYFVFQIDENICLRSWLDLVCRANHFQSQVVAQGSTNYSAVRPAQIFKLKIPLPPPDEQPRIVARIEALAARVSEAQRLRREVVEEAKSFMQAALRDVFSKAVTWHIYKLDDVAPINMGQSPSGDTYNFEKEGVPLLNGPTEFGDVHPIPKQWTSNPTKFCQSGDILICVRATIGKMNWADQIYCIGRGLAALSVDSNICVPKYVYY